VPASLHRGLGMHIGLSMWDLWWTEWHWDRFFPISLVSPVNSIPPWLSILIHHWGMNNRPIDGHSSETLCDPIDMNYLPFFLKDLFIVTVV
jgi:hypothetical protein